MILETNDSFEKASDPLVEQALSVKPEERNAETIAKARDATRAELAHLERGFAGEFFAGDVPGAADFTVYTILGFLRRCATRLPEIGFDDLIGPRFGAWMRRMDQLEYADACIPPHWKAAG